MSARHSLVLAPSSFVMVVLLTLVGGCGLQPVRTRPQLLDQARAPLDVRAAIVRALDRARFGAEQEMSGTLIATQTRGDQSMRVRIDYDATHYEVHLLDSIGYETRPDDETGEPLYDGRVAHTLRSIERRIERELRLEDRRRDRAVQAERQHQIDVAAASAPRYVQPEPAPYSAPAPAEPSTGEQVMGAIFGIAAQQASTMPTASYGVSHQSLHCCINGQYYSCPGREAYNQCAQSGPSMCNRDPSNDGRC